MTLIELLTKDGNHIAEMLDNLYGARTEKINKFLNEPPDIDTLTQCEYIIERILSLQVCYLQAKIDKPNFSEYITYLLECANTIKRGEVLTDI